MVISSVWPASGPPYTASSRRRSGAGRGAERPVLEVAAVGQFDVGEADVEPLVFVQ
jgi:hypothetical protein